MAERMRILVPAALPDTGTITRGGITGTIDSSGNWIPVAGTTIYTGMMRVRHATPDDMAFVFGDVTVMLMRHVAVLPYDSPDVHIGDELRVTVSSDPHIADHAFRVRAVAHNSYLTERLIGLEVLE